MPPRRKRPALRAVIPVSLPPKDGDRISRAAAKIDSSLSAFLRDAALEKADLILDVREPAASAA